MRSNDRVRSLCKTPFVCHLNFNTGTQHPLITQPALVLCTCWSLCQLCSVTKASWWSEPLHEREKYLGWSCESHFVYAHVWSNCSSCCWPESWQNIDDSRWKAGLSKQYERKQALAEMTAEPSKTTGSVGESGPNPTSLQAQSGENIKKATDR